MLRLMSTGYLLLAAVLAGVGVDSPRSAREGLMPLGDLVGEWRGTGTPAGSREDQRTGFWTETINCGWKFKGDDAWLELAFDKSKHYRNAELRFEPQRNVYRMRLETAERKLVTLDGSLQNRNLVLDSEAGDLRLVVTLLHNNRFLYRQETRPAGKTLYTKVFQVGATKEGVPFAIGSGQPECIVTGGLAKTAVMYQGKTYYVCCSGCRDEFVADPEKYIREAAAKKK